MGVETFGALRRFGSTHGRRKLSLRDDHAAVVEGRTLFPTRVFSAADRPRLLISGVNSRKIGKVVTKGKKKGMPIFTLTLEERKTCPRTCLEWKTCYGSNMQFAVRIKNDRVFEERLWEELADKQQEHPNGFLVRLHVLGDFYSTDYAELWAEALEAYPALHVFGYTARPTSSPIGQIIGQLLGLHPDRWHVRFSGYDGPTDGSVVIDNVEETTHTVCPMQLGKTECCATCGLCWHSDQTIAFLRH